MNHENTLFLLARLRPKPSGKKGVLESWMWTLDELDKQMLFVSFHKSKSDRAYMGGRILGFRPPTQEEYDAHQKAFFELEGQEMGPIELREIVLWERIPNWKVLWPPGGSNPMAYKARGYIAKA
jgi:hypothetical protein